MATARYSGDGLLPVARQALLHWDLRPRSIELVSTSENTVFKVLTESGVPYVLRIHRPGYHTLQELESEQLWTAALNDAGISAPVPVRSRRDRGYVTVPVPDGSATLNVGVTQWVDGELLHTIIEEGGDDALTTRFHQLGQIAGKIHNQACAWQLPPGFSRHSFDAEGLMGGAPFWGPFWELPEFDGGQRKLVLAARDAIYGVLAAKRDDHQSLTRTFSMIHADLHPHNVLVNGDRLHVIDFDDAGFGWHHYEFAVALSAYTDHPRYEVIRDEMLAGYRTEREFPDSEAALIPMFLLVRELVMLGWLLERPEIDRGNSIPRMIQRACVSAEAFLS